MKYRLKDKRRELLKAFVRSDQLERVIGDIEFAAEYETKTNVFLPDGKSVGYWNVIHTIKKNDLKAKMISVKIKFEENDFDIILPPEPLKLNVWYEKERFDGNPNGYLLVEVCVSNGGAVNYAAAYAPKDGFKTANFLGLLTTHFKYLEPPTKENVK